MLSRYQAHVLVSSIGLALLAVWTMMVHRWLAPWPTVRLLVVFASLLLAVPIGRGLGSLEGRLTRAKR